MTKKTDDKSRTLQTPDQPGKSRDRALAELAFSGVVNAAATTTEFTKNILGTADLTECIGVLSEKAADINKGNLQEAERLLIAQAYALDTIFASLARRAQLNMGEYINAADRYMRLALKAQGQCRATLETLANIKNPPLVVARQANIAHGPQQVNNTVNRADGNFQTNTHARAGAGNSKSVQNELLEERHDERVDIGAPQATGRGDPAMATVGEIHRPAQP